MHSALTVVVRFLHRLKRVYRVRRRIVPFRPILPGARLRDRLFACCGALIGIAAIGLLCRNLLAYITAAPALVAPIGASAVLLFAVPASPLAQPWPIIGGNTLSAFVGVTVAALVPDPALAGALAVALAIATMSMARCLHPPGGAAALTAVLGGPAVAAAGFGFVFVPVAINSILLVAAGWLFHRVSGHSYPHRAAPVPANVHRTNDPPPRLRVAVTPTHVDAAIEDLGDVLDVSRDDLNALLLQAELHAMERQRPDVACRDIMARDVVSVTADERPQAARSKLIAHAFRTLPVVDGDNRVIGLVGHQQLAGEGARVADVMAPAVTEHPDTPALRLLGRFSDGQTHEVVIVDDSGTVMGVVTQSDLLVVLARTTLLRTVRADRLQPMEA